VLFVAFDERLIVRNVHCFVEVKELKIALRYDILNVVTIFMLYQFQLFTLLLRLLLLFC
jgi:hypothetical protein